MGMITMIRLKKSETEMMMMTVEVKLIDRGTLMLLIMILIEGWWENLMNQK